MGLDSVYARGVLKHRDFFVAWPPGAKWRIGDWTESLDGLKFAAKEGNISDLGIPVALSTAQSTGGFEWYSASEVDVDTSISASASGAPVSAVIKVRFRRKNALYIRAEGTQHQYIDNLDEVGRKLVELYNGPDRKWRRSYRLITETMSITKMVVLISQASNAAAEIQASSPIQVAGAPVGQFAFTAMTTSSAVNVDKHEADAGATPFLRLGRVRNGLFSKPDYDDL